MATEVEFSVHLPILPSEERPFEEAQVEHQRPVWPGSTIASCSTPIHPEDHQGDPHLGPLPKPAPHVEIDPLLGIQHLVTL